MRYLLPPRVLVGLRSRTCLVSLLVGGLVLSGMLAMGPTSLRAQIPQRVIAETADNPTDVVAADLDGDGDKDMLSASAGDNKIAWYENQVEEGGGGSDGFGDEQVLSTDATDARSVAAADLDEDGDMDVLSASAEDNTIAWYENRIGEGNADSDGFSDRQIITDEAVGAVSVAAADLDGDEKPDVLSASFDDDTVAWYENQLGESTADGDGFGSPQSINTDAGGVQSVIPADLDGDGAPDIAFAAAGDNEVAWHENQIDENGGFSSQRTIYQNAQTARSVAAADLDGDTDLDLISASFLDNTVAWHENRIGENKPQNEGFSDEQIITTDATGATSVATADVDGDGALDVIAGLGNGNRVTWYENQISESGAGSSGFGTEQLVTDNTEAPLSVGAADLDGDGDPDPFSASSQDDKVAWYQNTNEVLPVELTAVEAQIEGETVLLSWRTASETNNAGFDVQRRVAGARASSSWATVGTVEGSGTTTQSQSYQLTDADLPHAADTLTYRLKQVDTDGSVHYSKTVTVQQKAKAFRLFGPVPNPARQTTTVQYTLPEGTTGTLRLYDAMGRQVRTIATSKSGGRHEHPLDVRSLPSGMYILKLTSEGQAQTQKMAVVK